MLNKPQGVISATTDPAKKTVIDIIPPELKRRSLFPAGRLDRDTVGLLIITDDGAFAHRIMSPAHHVFKAYEAPLSFPIDENDIRKLESGITLGDGTECLPAKVKAFTKDGLPAAEIKIREGKYHQVRRMMASRQMTVLYLERRCEGELTLGNLPRGQVRELTEKEKDALLKETTRVLCDSTSFFPAEINGEPCRMVILAYILYPISGEHSARYDILRYDVKP